MSDLSEKQEESPGGGNFLYNLYTKGKKDPRALLSLIIVFIFVAGLAASVILIQSQQDIREQAAGFANLKCPVEPKAGSVVIEMAGRFIRSDRREGNATLGPFKTSIAPGTYKVTLVSFDKDHTPDKLKQPKESWFLRLHDENNKIFAQTKAISDLPDNQTTLIEEVESAFVVEKQVSAVSAFHAAYRDRKNPNSVNPICAVFEPTEITASCGEVRAYDRNGNLLTQQQLNNMKAGDIVRFAVSGTTNAGNFDKARFTINGVQRPEVTQKLGTGEFYDEYVIPANTKNFNVSAQIHHQQLDKWF